MAGEKITAIEATYVLVPENGAQTVARDKTVVVEGDRIKEVCDHYDGPVDRRIRAEGRLLSPVSSIVIPTWGARPIRAAWRKIATW